jgi:hypothetical protein
VPTVTSDDDASFLMELSRQTGRALPRVGDQAAALKEFEAKRDIMARLGATDRSNTVAARSVGHLRQVRQRAMEEGPRVIRRRDSHHRRASAGGSEELTDASAVLLLAFPMTAHGTLRLLAAMQRRVHS